MGPKLALFTQRLRRAKEEFPLTALEMPRFRRVVYFSLAVDLSQTGLGFCIGVLVARGAGPVGRGAYSTTSLATALLAEVAAFGVLQAILVSQTPLRAPLKLLSSVGLAAAAFLVLAAILAPTLRNELLAYSPFPVGWCVLQGLLGEAKVRGSQQWYWLRITPLLLAMPTILIFTALNRLTASVALLTISVAHVLVAFVGVSLRSTYAGVRRSRHYWLKTGWQQQYVTLTRRLIPVTATSLVAILNDLKSAGIFAVAMSVATLIPQITWSLPQLLMQRASQEAYGPPRRSILILSYTLTSGAAILSAPFAAELLTVIYGSDFAVASGPLLVIIFSQGLWLHALFLESELRVLRARECGTAGATAFITLVLAGPPLTHLFGALGMALALACSTGLNLGMLLRLDRIARRQRLDT